MNLRRKLALSDHWIARLARATRRSIYAFHVPAPRVITWPLLQIVLAIRSVYYFCMRVFVCEPLFKAYCTKYGKNVHTGVFLHWVQGRGDIILGDNVTIDGKCSFGFATRFSDHPTLIIGDNTGVGHGAGFTVAKRIEIGKHCRIGSGTWMLDSPGHPAEPVSRMAGAPPSEEAVKPVVIEDNVWVGAGSTIMPGVRIGEGSIVSASSVVISNVPPYTLVGGNPARIIQRLVAPPETNSP